ncbi:transmembrane protein 214-A-like [Macrosteles quadrilineatus]|uniref:transmembrane protein 214-A-like n=1 Tax=Macrosteles quadrilineatus TaxID=74068 RepID=UPI0023E0C677|nr:transmembrane protein 214-A-like [Macrosteles quadrilineatus]
MSGQWEVVGKNKKDKQSGKSKKLSKDEKKKFVDNAPKVEDLIPLAQVKTLYSALDTNKELPKPVEKAVKTKENEAKKAQKKPKEKKEPVKESRPPKTIDAAVALITAVDVQNVLEVGQARFPDAPLVWLKGFASWLNTKLPVDHTDNTFTAKSWEYPLCLLHKDIRSVLKKALKEVPDAAVQMFFDYCLTSMANDMTKGSPVTGYKMLLQLVASQTPSVAVADLAKAATLRHSYQNRPAIGCSVMWALGQGGFKDILAGLQVWKHVMFPVYPLRNYTHFVTDYLKHLLARHLASKTITAKHYLDIVDVVISSTQPANHELWSHLKTLQEILCNSQPSNSLHSLVEPLLTRLSSNSSPPLRQELVRYLCHCLATDTQSWSEWRRVYTKLQPQSAILLRRLIWLRTPRVGLSGGESTLNYNLSPLFSLGFSCQLVRYLCHCLATDTQSWSEWRRVYTKLQPQSAILLRRLNADWESVSSQLPLKNLKETLRTFKVTNDDLHKSKQRNEGLQECSRLCVALLEKISGSKKSFPWKTIVFVVFLAVAGAVAFDSKVHNGFKASKTGVFLKDIGALKYGEQAFDRIKEVSIQGYRWSEVNVPLYTAKARELLGPYVSVAVDAVTSLSLQVMAAARAAVQYCVDKKPVVEQWVNQYAPGLAQTVTVWAHNCWELIKHYGLQAGTLALKYLSVSAEWLKENVFVGKFSPENLQRVTLEALNTTQAFAIQTMSWINSKMVTTGAEKV